MLEKTNLSPICKSRRMEESNNPVFLIFLKSWDPRKWFFLALRTPNIWTLGLLSHRSDEGRGPPLYFICLIKYRRKGPGLSYKIPDFTMWQWASNVTSLIISSHVWSDTGCQRDGMRWSMWTLSRAIYLQGGDFVISSVPRRGWCTHIRGALEGMESWRVAPNIATS